MLPVKEQFSAFFRWRRFSLALPGQLVDESIRSISRKEHEAIPRRDSRSDNQFTLTRARRLSPSLSPCRRRFFLSFFLVFAFTRDSESPATPRGLSQLAARTPRSPFDTTTRCSGIRFSVRRRICSSLNFLCLSFPFSQRTLR